MMIRPYKPGDSFGRRCWTAVRNRRSGPCRAPPKGTPHGPAAPRDWRSEIRVGRTSTLTQRLKSNSDCAYLCLNARSHSVGLLPLHAHHVRDARHSASVSEQRSTARAQDGCRVGLAQQRSAQQRGDSLLATQPHTVVEENPPTSRASRRRLGAGRIARPGHSVADHARPGHSVADL